MVNEGRPWPGGIGRVRAAVAAVALSMVLALAAEAWAEGSGLPVPRFVLLRSGEANMRLGPGKQYPIKWVYQRPGMPLEIIAEYYNWRHVRDWQGTEGWMHGSMLTGGRHAVVVGNTPPLYASPDPNAPIVAEVEAGVIADIRKCLEGSPWCEIGVKRLSGWITRADLWGVYRDEAIND